MPIQFEIAESIFVAEKQLISPVWRDIQNVTQSEQHRKLECRVAVTGGVPRGVTFRITLFPRNLNSAKFQLECDRPDIKSRVPLYRLELAPLSAHLNGSYGTDEINGLYIDPGVTHEHDFHDSLTKDGQLRLRSCEQARIVANPPSDFATALRYVCSRINVINAQDVPNPGTQGWLL
jgi:hypothetical protein